MVATGGKVYKKPRILFIDAYDSFTYNIVSVVECYLGVEVTVIKIDDSVDDLASYLRPFSAVIAGPGPGHPGNSKDAGLIQELWRLKPEDALPVLGICLGFQSLVLDHGGKVLQLAEPRHGMVRTIRASGDSIFADIRSLTAVQYHSLYAYIGESLDENINNNCRACRTTLGSYCPDLMPLAWDIKVDNSCEDLGLQKDNPDVILMGVAHREKPFYGVQFHPESICSGEEARKIIPNWWALAQRWNHDHRQHLFQDGTFDSPELDVEINTYFLSKKLLPNTTKSVNIASCKKSLDEQSETTTKNQFDGHIYVNGHAELNHQTRSSAPAEIYHDVDVITRTIEYSFLTVPDLCEILDLQGGELVVLDSERSQNLETGRYTVIGIMDPDTVKLEYNVGQPHVYHVSAGGRTMLSLKPYGESIFAYLKYFMGLRKIREKGSNVPFWGGLMGYITYEACLETLDIKSEPNALDLSFAYVERSIVIDHHDGVLYVQSIKDQDHYWVQSVASMLAADTTRRQDRAHTPAVSASILLPNERQYKEKIRSCFESLRKGDSYELCLTTECKVTMRQDTDPWALFRRLRERNAAPFAAFVRMGPLTHIASSPERFLSWSRPARSASPVQNGSIHTESEGDHRLSSTFQFRPIKGTVKRQPNDPTVPAVSLKQATAILSTPKERAENLMIVDLIRHDLHSVLGSGNVNVSKLMVVESYATLYQLVSVIEGTLYYNDSTKRAVGGSLDAAIDGFRQAHVTSTTQQDLVTSDQHHSSTQQALKDPPNTDVSGIDVLAASLPPGSMTGAPKRRSCNILQKIENRNRGVYSGVLGYLDVGGGGDFSVVIRSASKWDSADKRAPYADGSSVNAQDQTNERLKTDLQSSVGGESESKSKFVNGSVKEQDRDHDDPEGSRDPWTIGAGGAITCLSTEEGEWEEMYGKLSSTLAAFVDN